MKRILVSTALLVGLVAVLPQAMTAPEPSEVPTTWELGFDFKAPQPITITLPGRKKSSTFWYMRYTVTNLSRNPDTGRGADQRFTPEFILYTDTGQASVSGRRLLSSVYAAIKKRHNNPLLKDHTQVGGKLLYGKDNARDSVAIWPDFDPKAGSIDIFVGGLSGETAELKLPRPVTTTETDADGIEQAKVSYKIILHKSLQLSFSIKGESGNRTYTKAKFTGKKWVLR
ncbi:MAG: hypothetical protein QGH60_04780 [Phycisphaerae bacterium]|jgi:hypothetical protein|nr:hypothetical protein [Phycisphaerae bacterium]